MCLSILGLVLLSGRTYIDDNFGTYVIESDEDIEWYNQVQRESVWKWCVACRRRVKLRPDYSICNSCTEILEKGGDPY